MKNTPHIFHSLAKTTLTLNSHMRPTKKNLQDANKKQIHFQFCLFHYSQQPSYNSHADNTKTNFFGSFQTFNISWTFLLKANSTSTHLDIQPGPRTNFIRRRYQFATKHLVQQSSSLTILFLNVKSSAFKIPPKFEKLTINSSRIGSKTISLKQHTAMDPLDPKMDMNHQLKFFFRRGDVLWWSQLPLELNCIELPLELNYIELPLTLPINTVQRFINKSFNSRLRSTTHLCVSYVELRSPHIGDPDAQVKTHLWVHWQTDVHKNTHEIFFLVINQTKNFIFLTQPFHTNDFNLESTFY